MKLLRFILFPLVPIYYLITSTRNALYELGMIKSKSFKFPVVCVGNLSVGGTGKTPMIEYLIRLLKTDYKVATLSRGYKRQTKGFYLGDEKASATSLGDEPFQFYNKFKKDVLVAVDANRVKGIKKLKSLKNSPDVILLDDAFQHRRVKAGLNIILSTYDNLYINDWLLPTGDLRESRRGANRAQIIVVTKCPKDISRNKRSYLKTKIKPKSYQHVFFSSIAYSSKIYSQNNSLRLQEINEFTLVTGIADPSSLVDFLDEKNLKFDHLKFKDHHDFSSQEILEFKSKKLILTTEKDFMRLMKFDELKDKLFYLPIELNIVDDLKFNKLVLDSIRRQS